MADWNLLPPELRLIILEILAQDTGNNKPGRKAGLAHYATVSKEWQAVFAKGFSTT